MPEITTDNNIIVPPLGVEFTEEQLSYLQENVDPLQDDGNNGIEHFLKVLDILERF